MYSFNHEIQQDFSVLSSKKSHKSSKANCMLLTFALLAENSSNKIMAFKSFMSYFGFERSDLMMQNYVNTPGLQTNLKKPWTQTPNTLFDNFKLHWSFAFPRLRALLSMMIFHFWSPLPQSKRWHFITHVTTKLLLLYNFIFSIVSVGQSGQSKSLLQAYYNLRWTRYSGRLEWAKGKNWLKKKGT